MSSAAYAPPEELTAAQAAWARFLYRKGRRRGLPPGRSRELVHAAWSESRLDPEAVNKSSGAAGFFQLLSQHYRDAAERLGGLFNPDANTEAILPDYIAYWRRKPTAQYGEAARDVERSGEGAHFYSKDRRLFAWLTDESARATSQPRAVGVVHPLGDPSAPISSRYGESRGDHAHQGVDLPAPRGREVLAPEAGTAQRRTGGAGGNAIWINGKHYLAHLDKFAVADGAKVEAGDVVGYVGSTGTSTGPHLHYGYDPLGTYGANWTNPQPVLFGALGRAAAKLLPKLGKGAGKAAPGAGGAAGGMTIGGAIAAGGAIGAVAFLLQRLGLTSTYGIKYGVLWLLGAMLGLVLIVLGLLRLLGLRTGTVVNVVRGAE